MRTITRKSGERRANVLMQMNGGERNENKNEEMRMWMSKMEKANSLEKGTWSYHYKGMITKKRKRIKHSTLVIVSNQYRKSYLPFSISVVGLIGRKNICNLLQLCYHTTFYTSFRYNWYKTIVWFITNFSLHQFLFLV